MAGPLQINLIGSTNAFVSKLNAAGSALVYSTYLGGSNIDSASAIAVDAAGAAYVTGDTSSIDFPTTPGVVQNRLLGLYNAFVSKLAPNGNSLVYSTLLGGSGTDIGTSIAIDPAGRTIIGGYTTSANFPTFQAIQLEFQGVFDAFSTVLDPSGVSLIFSSYFGGSNDDRGLAIAAVPVNKLVLAGITSSTNFPLEATLQPNLSVAPDAFVANVTYIVLAGAPAANSVTPSSGSGSSQTFTLQYSDTAGTPNLQQVGIYFNATLANPAANSCQLFYNISTNQINLLNDAGTPGQPGTPGAGSTLGNSQCSVNLANATVAMNGNTLTLSLPMTFSTSFVGAKNIYLSASDVAGSSTGFKQLGTWTVPGAVGVPAVISVSPSLGSGTSQTFTLQYSDTAGASNLQTAWVYFNSTLANPAANACMLYYNAPTNQVNLLNDNATAWLPAIVGSAATLQNSQCSLNVAATTVVLGGNNLTWNVAMTFNPAYAGAKNVYLHSTDASGASRVWLQLGAWTVAAATPVTAQTVSVTPNSGSGSSQIFSLQYSDSNGAGNLEQVWVYFNATLATPAAAACMLCYNLATSQINLLNDTATAWLPANLGSATTYCRTANARSMWHPRLSP